MKYVHLMSAVMLSSVLSAASLENGYDVVVAGGGPAGIGAAYAAAKRGAKTLLIEKSGRLGGMAIQAQVSPFALAVNDETVREIVTKAGLFPNVDFVSADVRLYEMLREVGCDVLLHSVATAPVMSGNRVTGVEVFGVEGKRTIPAKVTIDCTGDGSVAAAAGVPYEIGRKRDGLVQPMSIMFVIGGIAPGKRLFCYEERIAREMKIGNRTWEQIVQEEVASGNLPPEIGVIRFYPSPDENANVVNATQVNGLFGTRSEDLTQAEIVCRKQAEQVVAVMRKHLPGYENIRITSMPAVIGVRETRRFEGVERLTTEDCLFGRKRENAIAKDCSYVIDIHNPAGGGQAENREGGTSGDARKVKPYDIPYGAIVPKKIEGLLFAGRCLSASHEALASCRVMGIAMATGVGAGTAAAYAVEKGVSLREVPFGDEVPSFTAEPVWPQGKGTERNSAYRFVCEIPASPFIRYARLRYAAASFAKVTLDGEFLSFGPARAPTGWHRVEEIPLTLAPNKKHTLAFEVVAYNINTFCESERPGVLQAEVVADGLVLAATRAKGGDFTASEIPRIRKVSRYSFQRGFNEAYRLPGKAEMVKLEKCPPLKLLPRRAPMPDFSLVERVTKLTEYDVVYHADKKVRSNWCEDGTGHQKGFLKQDQELCVFEDIQRYVPTNVVGNFKGTLYRLDRLETGFPSVRVKCTKPGKVVMRFAEVLSDGRLDPCRDCTGNGIVWELSEPGEYELSAFEPYAFMYMDVIVGDGLAAEVPRMRRFQNPTMTKAQYRGKDPVLRSIFEAARNTIAQNSPDIFMDCPGRERAGWLCDSFFSARAAQLFSGRTDVEQVFLENFEKAECFRGLPEGMVAECYPADHPEGSFITNWAMWFIIEIDDYVRRTGDRELARRLLPRVKGVVEFISKYENSDGLLEKLPSWIFIEWSEANKHVKDVSYPSNMLWAEALDAASRLMNNRTLANRAAKIRETIVRQSFDGKWFHDNAIRQADGTLKLGTATTETCQYYAFWTKTATPKSHAALWETLTTEFGPKRKQTKTYPDVAYSNAFIGNYLRLMILSREGLREQVLEEIRGYFATMAATTGTLWEFDSTHASCCHGFASYVGVLIDECTR